MASAKRRAAWGVAVRLADGRRLYYSPHGGRQGQSDWSPRESQAHRYETQEAAEHVAAKFATNSEAREYLTVRLT